MNGFGGVMIVIMSVLFSIFFGVILFEVAADFTCQKLGGIRIDNQCVQVVNNNQ